MISHNVHPCSAVTSRKAATIAPAEAALLNLASIELTRVRPGTGHLFMKTIPRSPSTLSLSPVLIFLVACWHPVTAGMPYSLATMTA